MSPLLLYDEIEHQGKKELVEEQDDEKIAENFLNKYSFINN